ncbi:MAG: ribonuclease HIII [Bacilli bacterium]
MSKKYYSTKIDENKSKEIIDLLKMYETDEKAEYLSHSFLYKDLQIKLYSSKKGITLSLAGEENSIDKFLEKINVNKYLYLSFESQIGSDEVGNGDLLLPFIVVAVYINEENLNQLLKLSINDSKKMNDQTIVEIVPKLIKYVDFSKMTLQNNQYNEVIKSGDNINVIKAKMHNATLLNMKKKHNEVNSIFIDKFVSDETFYKYLKNEKEVITNITSRTKGETYYPSIAVASMIARYSLIKEKEKLDKKYKMNFPFGSGQKVDEFSKMFIEKYGIEEFNKIVKINFKNIKRII